MTRPEPGTRKSLSVSSRSCDRAGSGSGCLTVALCPPGLMGTSTVEQLLENVCLLLASRTRDVVKSALGFIKVAVVVMDVAHLAKLVQLVVSARFPLWVATWPGCHHGTKEPQGQQVSSVLLATAALCDRRSCRALEGTGRGMAAWWRKGHSTRAAACHPHLFGPSAEARARQGKGQWAGPSLILQTGILSSETAPGHTAGESSPGNRTQSSGLRLWAPPAGPSSPFFCLLHFGLRV